MDRLTAAVVLCLGLAAPVRPEPPLPNPDAVLLDVRRRLEAGAAREHGYAYLETRRERQLDGDGRVNDESVKVYEIHPGLPGEDGWERLVSENGRPLSAERLAEQDREREEEVQAYLRRFASDPAAACEERRRERDRERRRQLQTIDDVFRVFEMRLTGRTLMDGASTLVFALSPRPDAQPRTKYGRVMKKLAGRAWIDELDRELVGLDIEAIDTITIGWGVVARLHEGSHASYRRSRASTGEWLPARLSYTLSARLGLVKIIRRSQTSEYSDYRKAEAEVTVACSDTLS